MSTPDGGPAFLRSTAEDGGWKDAPVGVSLRDYFAGQALAGALAAVADKSWGPESWTDSKLAQHCYEMADAMLKAREQL